MTPKPFEIVPDGARMPVRLTPRASREGVQGLAFEADGSTVVKMSVTAPPEDGKANAALIKLLATAWGVPKSSISIASGAASRRKTVLVAGERPAIRRKLESWWEGIDG